MAWQDRGQEPIGAVIRDVSRKSRDEDLFICMMSILYDVYSALP